MKDYSIFAEKYRPKTLDETVGQEHLMLFFKGFAKNKTIPHMLFAGPPGTGKTTVAKALARDIFGKDWKSYFYETNASDARKLSDIRQKIKEIARISTISGNYKIIFMDEADSLDHLAQPALRRIIEDYSDICRFILSCNYPSKIINPIKDRLVDFRFKKLKTKDVAIMLNNIVEKENIDISKSAIHTLATLTDGSMRRALGILSAFNMAGIDKIDDEKIYDSVYWVTDDDIKKWIIFMIQGKLDTVNKQLNFLLDKKSYSYKEIFESMDRIIKESKIIPIDAKLRIIQKMADTEYRLSRGASEHIQLKGLMVYMMLVFKKYMRKEK